MERLDIVQVRLDKYLFDRRRLEKEKEKARQFRKLSWVKELLIKQKSRIKMRKKWDQNTGYFFKCINVRGNINAINGRFLKDR